MNYMIYNTPHLYSSSTTKLMQHILSAQVFIMYCVLLKCVGHMEGAQAGKQQTDCHSPQYNAAGKGAGNDASLAAAAHKPETEDMCVLQIHFAATESLIEFDCNPKL